MERKLDNYSQVELQRISGVTPQNLTELNIDFDKTCDKQSPPEVCCLLSHLKAIYIAYMAGHQFAIISEDDFFVLEMPNFLEIAKRAPPDWNIIQLFVSGIGLTNYEQFYNHPTPFVRYQYEYWGTVIYMINRDGMHTLLQKYMPMHRDDLKWEQVKIQLKNNIGKFCAADYALYDPVNTYTYTRPHFNIEKNNENQMNRKSDHDAIHAKISDAVAGYFSMYKTWHSSIEG